MSKKPWKSRTRTRKPAPPAEVIFGERPADERPAEPHVADTTTLPPPLPPLGGAGSAPDNGGFDQPPAGAVLFDESKIQAGLGRAFCSVTQGIGRLANYALRNGPYRVEMDPVLPEEGDLWATFAFPVLKMYLPNLEQSPVLTLSVMTALILSGKIKIVKAEVVTNVTAEPRTEAAAAA